MCRGLIIEVTGVCIRCSIKSIKVWTQPQCLQNGIYVSVKGPCIHGYDDYVAPTVETRGFTNSGLLKTGCMQCLEPHSRWLDYRNLHIDGSKDELGFYLEDAALHRSDAIWQQRQYDLAMLQEAHGHDLHDPTARDYDPNDPPIREGPLKLIEHRDLMERMENKYSGRGIPELQGTWLSHHYNDLIEDVDDDPDHPAYPYDYSGFEWEPPVLPEEESIAGAQFEYEEDEQRQAHSREESLQLDVVEDEEEEEEYYYTGEGDPIQEYGQSDAHRRFFQETPIGRF